jgi:hypothetical protein
MALRKIIALEGKASVQTAFGIVETGAQQVSFSAYVKVMSISGDKSQLIANVQFVGDVAKFNKQYQIPVSIETNAPNFIAQVYEYLKTLPEFVGAENC